MKKILSYILLLSVVFLTGCETLWKKNPETITVTKTILVVAPKGMVIPCKKVPPPEKASYVKLTYEQKEEALVDLTTKLYTQIDKCNLGITAYEKWSEDQLKLYPKQE